MARGKTDEEMLALGRTNRMLEDLEDPRARARVAHFLYLRFTAAGEEIVPFEDRVSEIKPIAQTPPPQLSLQMPTVTPSIPSSVDAPQASATPPGPPVPTTRPGASTAGAGGTATDPPAPGWNISGQGSAHDDTPLAQPDQKKAGKTKVTPAGDGSGWDLNVDDPNAEVEVKI
jgi:hypothetical protein